MPGQWYPFSNGGGDGRTNEQFRKRRAIDCSDLDMEEEEDKAISPKRHRQNRNVTSPVRKYGFVANATDQIAIDSTTTAAAAFGFSQLPFFAQRFNNSTMTTTMNSSIPFFGSYQQPQRAATPLGDSAAMDMDEGYSSEQGFAGNKQSMMANLSTNDRSGHVEMNNDGGGGQISDRASSAAGDEMHYHDYVSKKDVPGGSMIGCHMFTPPRFEWY